MGVPAGSPYAVQIAVYIVVVLLVRIIKLVYCCLLQVWLSEGKLLVLKGGSTPDRDGFDNPWQPIDSYEAPTPSRYA